MGNQGKRMREGREGEEDKAKEWRESLTFPLAYAKFCSSRLITATMGTSQQ